MKQQKDVAKVNGNCIDEPRKRVGINLSFSVGLIDSVCLFLSVSVSVCPCLCIYVSVSFSFSFSFSSSLSAFYDYFLSFLCVYRFLII